MTDFVIIKKCGRNPELEIVAKQSTALLNQGCNVTRKQILLKGERQQENAKPLNSKFATD